MGTDECTNDRVNLGKKSGSYCRMCYRAVKRDSSFKGLKVVEKRMKCTTSRMGCPQCQEEVCDSCWDKGYNMHK